MAKKKKKLELHLDVENILDDTKLSRIRGGAELFKTRLLCPKPSNPPDSTTSPPLPRPNLGTFCGSCKEQSAPRSVAGGGGSVCMYITPNDNSTRIQVKSRNCFLNE